MGDATALPPGLQAVVDDFADTPREMRLELLLEYADRLRPLPEPYASAPDLLERVEECQSPVYIFVEVDEDHMVHVFATAPKEAPTTRGFASILVNGLSGLTAAQVLAVTPDFPNMLGLGEIISLLRLRGMTGMLGRIKRQVAEKLG